MWRHAWSALPCVVPWSRRCVTPDPAVKQVRLLILCAEGVAANHGSVAHNLGGNRFVGATQSCG
jgi:hypothetical protein